MKKTVFRIVTAALLLAVLLSVFCSCGSLGGAKEKYNLVDIDFLNVTVSHYEYNYITFDFDNGTYVLKNKVKANGIVTEQTGKFTVDKDDNVTFTNDQVPTQDYVLYDGEDAYFDGDKLYIEAYIDGYGEVSMVFEK